MRAGLTEVALVGPLPPPSGGMANQTKQLKRLLVAEGVKVRLIQVNRAYRPRWVEDIRGVRALTRLVPYAISLWRTARSVDLFHVMANSGWSWHLFAAPAIWIATMRGRPVVVNYRGGEADTFFGRAFRIVKPTLKRASVVIVPSEYLRSVFDRWGIATVVVPNIVDLTRFHPGDRAHKLDSQRGPHLIVTRNLEPIYDVATALRVFERVKRRWSDARLTVAGSGPERKALEMLAEELGVADSVKFVGRLDNEAIPELYRSGDIMLNTSLVDNMPVSFLEAMATGVPIVSTDVGGIPYLVKHGEHAVLAPAGDVAQLAEAVELVWEDRSTREQMVNAGLALVGQFEWKHVRARLFSVYAAILSHKSGAVSERGDV